MRVIILIPTYNERDNVRALIRKIYLSTRSIPDIDFTVCVIDDSSPDGTLDAVKELAESEIFEDFNICTISRTTKEGLGRAYIDGFERTLNSANNYEYIIQMDADLSHDPIYIRDFVISARHDADLVVGSRYIAGGAIPHWVWYRRMLSKFGNFYASSILSPLITDYTGGYNMYSTKILRQLNFVTLNDSGYGFLIALKYRMLNHTNKVSQIPIVFYERSIGESKMPINTVLKNFVLVLALKFWR